MKGNVKKSIVTRIRLAFLGVSLFSCAIVWKVTQIQFAQGEQWRALEQERRVVYQPCLPPAATYSPPMAAALWLLRCLSTG